MGGPGTAGTGASGIPGRSDELAALRLALAATPGQGSTLVLRGEPGAGKSALLDDVARQTREVAWQLLRTAGRAPAAALRPAQAAAARARRGRRPPPARRDIPAGAFGAADVDDDAH